MWTFSEAYIAESALPGVGAETRGGAGMQGSEGLGRRRGTPAVFLGAGLPPGEEKHW